MLALISMGVFASWRMMMVLWLGFSSGLPLSLTTTTLQAWLTDAKVDLPTIGKFALIGLPYTVKFLWAPFLDTYRPPFLGRRRGWALIIQALLAAAIAGLAFCDPVRNLTQYALVALLIAFCSASQDIVLDAFRIEILQKDEMGAGAGVYVTGYRLALLVSGALALAMADHMSWRSVYLIMALVMLLGIGAVWNAPEPPVPMMTGPRVSFRERVIQPFAEFFKRSGAFEILLFAMIYKLSTMMATALTTNFLMSRGFEKTQIGAMAKTVGLAASIVGALSGGALMVKLGIKRALWIFGILQSLAGLSFLLLTQSDKSALLMGLVLGVENFMIGLGVAAISGFMMSVCSRQFTATQFALLSSLTAVSRVVLVSQSGTLADSLGWAGYFILSVALAIPGLLLLTRYDRWQLSDTPGEAASIGRVDVAVIGLFVFSLAVISFEPIWGWWGFKQFGTWTAKLGAAGIGLTILTTFLRPRKLPKVPAA